MNTEQTRSAQAAAAASDQTLPSNRSRNAAVPVARFARATLFSLILILLFAGALSGSAARVPEYNIILELEPINCDLPTTLNPGLEYRLPSSETGADNSNYRFREMRTAFQLRGRKGKTFEYRATVNQRTGINFSTLWTLHFQKKRRAVELRFNHSDYAIQSYAGDTFYVKAPASTPDNPTIRLVGTISLQPGPVLGGRSTRTPISVVVDNDTISKADLTFGPVDIQLTDDRPLLQVLPDGSARTASFSNLAELGSKVVLAAPSANRMFRIRIGHSARVVMISTNPQNPAERQLVIRHRDISSWVPPKKTAPMTTTGGAVVTRTNIVTIPMTNLVTVVKTNLVSVPKTNLVMVTRTNVVNVPKTNLVMVTRTNVVNVPKTNVVTVTRTNLVKVTKPVGITAVFALLPRNAPGVVPADYELGFNTGTGAPKSMGSFDANGSLTTAALPEGNRELPLFFRRRGDSTWNALKERVNPKSKSSLNVIEAMALLPGEPVVFEARLLTKSLAAGDAKIQLLAADKPTGISANGAGLPRNSSGIGGWQAAVSGALAARLVDQPLEIRAQASGFRQTTAAKFANLAALREALERDNGAVTLQLRPKVDDAQRGLAIILDPARRWANFTQLRNQIADELFDRIDAQNGLKAPLIVGADRGPYDTVRPADFKDPDFDLYSFFFNGFRDQAVRSGMMTPKNAAEVVGRMDDDNALAQRLEAHGGWNIVCIMPHNPGGETVGNAPGRETVQELIDALRLADARLLVIENGSTSRYLTALQDRVRRMTGDNTLFRHHSRKEIADVMELVKGEIGKFVPSAPKR